MKVSLKSKLNRMKKHISKEENKPVEKPAQHTGEGDIPFLAEWQAFSSVPHYVEKEYIFVRKQRYSLNHQHGLYSFGELFEVKNQWVNSDVSHPLSLKSTEVEELFFFDTETTGLSHGTGTTVFLLGVGKVTSEEVEVTQYLLPSPSAEAALYYSFLQDLEQSKLSVHYNGKSFDWPQVRTRHTLLRNQLPALPSFEHFDLLHPARRLWKHRMESVKLTKVEQDILQVQQREDDIPGFLAPMIYFDYIESKDPKGIFEVMKHNERDILSLITLYIHISKGLLGVETKSQRETFEIAKWYDKLGDQSTAQHFYETITADSVKYNEAQMALAKQYKKQKQWDEAIGIWESLVGEEEAVSLEAGIELAKVYEHQKKDVAKALRYAEASYEKWAQNEAGTEREEDAFQKRIGRLVKKLGRQ